MKITPEISVLFQGLVIVYDITDRSSFEKVGDWLESVDSVS